MYEANEEYMHRTLETTSRQRLELLQDQIFSKVPLTVKGGSGGKSASPEEEDTKLGPLSE